MENKTLTTAEKNAKKGKRLKEVLRMRGYKQSYLLHIACTRYMRPMASGQLSQIINGKKPLKDDYAHIFSKILDIDPGYLMAMDEYKASTYNEYLELVSHAEDVQASFAEFRKYDYILNPFGYFVIGMEEFGDSYNYDIKHKGKCASLVPAHELDLFVKDVQEYIDIRMKPIMMKYADIDLEKIENSTQAKLIELKRKNKKDKGDR